MPTIENKIKLFSHFDRKDDKCALQIGSFNEYITVKESRAIADIAFALARKAGSHNPQASIGIECSAWRAKELIKESEGLGEGFVVHKDHRSKFVQLLHLGTISVCIGALSQEATAEAILMSWPESPIVVGVNTLSDTWVLKTDWLNEGVVPPSAIVDTWQSILVSFYHGASISLYGQDSCAPDMLELISDVLKKYDIRLSPSSIPL